MVNQESKSGGDPAEPGIYLLVDGAFNFIYRTSRVEVIVNRGTTRQLCVKLLRLAHDWSPKIIPYVAVSTGHFDIAIENLIQHSPDFSQKNKMEVINELANVTIDPLLVLNQILAKRSGKLWLALVIPRPDVFTYTPQVSQILSAVYVKINNFIRSNNRVQGLTQLSLDQYFISKAASRRHPSGQLAVLEHKFKSNLRDITHTTSNKVARYFLKPVLKKWDPQAAFLRSSPISV